MPDQRSTGSEEWELPRGPEAALAARGHLDRHRDALPEDSWRRGRLLVSELATNAVRHGRGRILLHIDVHDAAVRVTVADEGRRAPEPREPGRDGGYGLHLLADLSDRWGRGAVPSAMWFELDRDDGA